jgi:hypothetical protein
MAIIPGVNPSEFFLNALWFAGSLVIAAVCISSIAVVAFAVTEKARDFEAG